MILFIKVVVTLFVLAIIDNIRNNDWIPVVIGFIFTIWGIWLLWFGKY